ncbi:MAG: hypothetical protein Q7S79_02295 [bacterium]|nr:hypothetical protein [bacterium]
MAEGRHVPGVFKTVIAPIQSWLLSQGRCVGCGKELSGAKASKGKNGGSKVTCECGRIFVNDSGKYRRALLEEV